MGKKKEQKLKKNAPKEISSGAKETKKAKQKEESKSLDQFLETWDDDDADDSGEGDGDMSEEEEGEESDADAENKKYLDGLQKKDPEFYKFLKENDEKLLNFDEESDEDDNEGESATGAHQAPDELEVASDESDFEDDDEGEEEEEKFVGKGGKIKVTAKMLEEWEAKLGSEPTVTLISDTAEVFKAAIDGLGSVEASAVTEGKAKKAAKKGKKDDEEGKKAEKQPPPGRFVVKGGQMFNAVVRLCLSKMEPALRKVLRLEKETAKANRLQKSKKWTACNRPLKSYTLELVRLLSVLSEASVASALLKHVHVMLPFYSALPKSQKQLTRLLVERWSADEDEGVRILAFLCLIRLTRLDQASMYESTAKAMYLAYVKNCKFTREGHYSMMSCCLKKVFSSS